MPCMLCLLPHLNYALLPIPLECVLELLAHLTHPIHTHTDHAHDFRRDSGVPPAFDKTHNSRCAFIVSVREPVTARSRGVLGR